MTAECCESFAGTDVRGETIADSTTRSQLLDDRRWGRERMSEVGVNKSADYRSVSGKHIVHQQAQLVLDGIPCVMGSQCKARFPLPELTARELGCILTPVNSGRQLGCQKNAPEFAGRQLGS